MGQIVVLQSRDVGVSPVRHWMCTKKVPRQVGDERSLDLAVPSLYCDSQCAHEAGPLNSRWSEVC